MLTPLCPRLVVPSVLDLDVEFFRTRGLEGALLDLDNTLVLWHGSAIDPQVLEWAGRMQRAGLRFCLASNTHRPGRLSELAGLLGVPYERGVAKPGRAGMRRCLARVGTAPEATAMIGDQLFTDIWGGNRCGLYTVLVRPLSAHEFVGTRLISRPLERLVMAELRRRGLFPEEQKSEARL